MKYLTMGEVRKALKKVLGLKAYMMREKEERMESLRWEEERKFNCVYN